MAAPVVGMLSDRYGRKTLLQFGIVTVGISMVCMGYSTNIYPQYCLARVFKTNDSKILYAIGAITLATIPFLADYVETDTKGRASAIMVVLASLGAVFSATVITNQLLRGLPTQTAYISSAIGITCVGIFYSTGLKPGVYFKERATREERYHLCSYHSISERINSSVQIIYKDADGYVDYDQEMRTLA